jgi:hypothetical protein
MAHVAEWSEARPGDVLTGHINGPTLVVARRLRRKCDAAALAYEVGGSVWIDYPPGTWAVCLYLEPSQ